MNVQFLKSNKYIAKLFCVHSDPLHRLGNVAIYWWLCSATVSSVTQYTIVVEYRYELQL